MHAYSISIPIPERVMKFNDLLLNHFVTSMTGLPLHALRYQALDKNDTLADYVSVAPGDSARRATFFQDAEVHTVKDNVVEVRCVDDVFCHYKVWGPVKLFEPQGERDINLNDIRMEVTEPNRLWAKVGKFDVLLNHTDDGIVVDVWPWIPSDHPVMPDEPLGTCYAFDCDADDALNIEP
jgi:hypothetical protein